MKMKTDGRPPLVIIAGPTASGKSDTAVALAERLEGEVISADSMQVYRGMDIGSAKITPEEMQGVPHHLVDILDPTEEWNVVAFQKMAGQAASQIRDRARLPILCGGTGFYIQSLLYGIDFSPMEEDTAYRDRLWAVANEDLQEIRALTGDPEAVFDADHPGRLYQELQAVDPKEAEEVHPNNIKRIIRALEFYHQSGQQISLHNQDEHTRPAAYDAVFFVLSMDRAKLYDRIDRRVDLMMEAGLVEEVKRLKDMGLTDKDVAMQGIGYRQILWALDGKCSMEEAVSMIKRDTRHFAKRQLTWFRREENMGRSKIHWILREDYENAEEMISHMEGLVRDHYGI